MSIGVMKDDKLNLRDLHVSDTLGLEPPSFSFLTSHAAKQLFIMNR